MHRTLPYIALLLLSFFFWNCLLLADVKINELYYDHPSSDEGYEWIELYNNGTSSVNLKNWKIETAGTYFTESFVLPDVSIDSGEFLLIGESQVANVDVLANFEPDLPNGGTETDGVRIISANGDTIDTILYDSPNDNGLPGDANQPGIYFAPDVSAGHSLIRFPDGVDTDNCETDFFDCSNPTPSKPNFLQQDLELTSVSILPVHPDTTDEVHLSFEIKNNSQFPIFPDSCHYEICIDDSLFLEDTVKDTIFAEETINIEQSLGILQSGLYGIYIQIFFSGDNEPDNNTITTSFLIGKTPIIITEIMYKPSSPNVEWIEIFNRSDYNFSILDWKISDSQLDWNSIETNKIIPSNFYAVICQDSNAVKNYYGNEILIFQTDDWSTLNNTTPDEIHFADKYFTQLDSVYYNPTELFIPDNFSIERINPYEDISDNWDVCIDSIGATPGMVNSITPLDFDIQATKIEIDKQNEPNIILTGFCQNVGFNDLSDCQCLFFVDYNFNRQMDEGENIGEETFSIASGVIHSFTIQFDTSEKCYYLFGFSVSNADDINNQNNIVFTSYNSPVNYPIAISEIMFAPEGDNPEWLEIYQNFDHSINLNGWQIADAGDTLVLSYDVVFSPREYLILVSSENDSSDFIAQYPQVDCKIIIGLPTLNNDEDKLILFDNFHTIIDSVYYKSDWGEDIHNSLERVNMNVNSNLPSNWESSLKGATPGEVNSIYVDKLPKNVSLYIIPNPISLRNKTSVLISYDLPEVLSEVNIRIFDIKGRLIKKIVDQCWFASQGEITWNCRNEDNVIVPTGIYIVQLEAVGKASRKVYKKVKTMVIGEK